MFCGGADFGFLRDLEKRIAEVEMDLTLAKSQGYLRNQLKPNESAPKKLLAVIGVYTGFGSRLTRNAFRGSWMPTGYCLYSLFDVLTTCSPMIYLSPSPIQFLCLDSSLRC